MSETGDTEWQQQVRTGAQLLGQHDNSDIQHCDSEPDIMLHAELDADTTRPRLLTLKSFYNLL